MKIDTVRVVTAVVVTTLLAFAADAGTKRRIYKDVYDDKGIVPLAVELDGEIYILVSEDKAREREGELSECRLKMPYQRDIIEQQRIAIEKLGELAADRKQDLSVCVEDRRQAHRELSKLAQREQPFFEKTQVNQALGFAVCAATFAVWQWSDQ